MVSKKNVFNDFSFTLTTRVECAELKNI